MKTEGIEEGEQSAEQRMEGQQRAVHPGNSLKSIHLWEGFLHSFRE
jgi:hypothetical protein